MRRKGFIASILPTLSVCGRVRRSLSVLTIGVGVVDLPPLYVSGVATPPVLVELLLLRLSDLCVGAIRRRRGYGEVAINQRQQSLYRAADLHFE